MMRLMAWSYVIPARCTAAAKPASNDRHGLEFTSRIHGRPSPVHPEVDADVATQAKLVPAVSSQPAQCRQQGTIGRRKLESPRRMVIFKGALIPLRLIADDPRFVGRKITKVDFGRRQYLGAGIRGQHRQVELAPLQIRLGKMRLASRLFPRSQHLTPTRRSSSGETIAPSSM